MAGIIGLFVAIPVVAFVLAVVGSAVEILGVGPARRRPRAVPWSRSGSTASVR